jgi:hypothetical protein
MVCPATYNPTGCKIDAVIHFHNTTNTGTAEIHHESCAGYGQNVMSEGTVRQ